jgi:hypothetical protein
MDFKGFDRKNRRCIELASFGLGFSYWSAGHRFRMFFVCWQLPYSRYSFACEQRCHRTFEGQITFLTKQLLTWRLFTMSLSLLTECLCNLSAQWGWILLHFRSVKLQTTEGPLCASGTYWRTALWETRLSIYLYKYLPRNDQIYEVQAHK